MNKRTKQIVTSVEIEWKEVMENISAYKKTVSKSTGKNEVEEGLAYTSELEDETRLEFSAIKQGENDYLFAVTPDFFEISRELVFKESMKHQLAMEDEKPFTTFQEIGELTLVYMNHYSGYSKHLDGNIVVMKVRFDYMSDLDNSTYNLEDALDKLKQKGERIEPVKGDEIAISIIPYYNADSIRKEHIEILYLPTQEEMNYVAKNRNKKQDVLFKLFDMKQKKT